MRLRYRLRVALGWRGLSLYKWSLSFGMGSNEGGRFIVWVLEFLVQGSELSVDSRHKPDSSAEKGSYLRLIDLCLTLL